MKIGITGHTSGIGEAFGTLLTNKDIDPPTFHNQQGGICTY